MNKKEQKFRLIGFINPYCVQPAFVYPIFESSKQYYFEDGDNYRIKKFIKTGDGYLQKQFCSVEDTRQYAIGDETIYAYQTQENGVIYGSGKFMLSTLAEIRKNVTNSLLSDEIDAVLNSILCAVRREEIIDLCSNSTDKKTVEVRIREVNSEESPFNKKAKKTYAIIHHFNRDTEVLDRNNTAMVISQPSKTLVSRNDDSYRIQQYQYYSYLVRCYTRLLTEFYTLYERLVKIKHPSYNWLQMYDLEFLSKFIQVVIIQSEVCFQEEDLFTIYQRLNFKNRHFYLSQNVFCNDKALRLSIKKLTREAEHQRKINSLFCEMIDTSSYDISPEVSNLEIRCLEEV